MTVVKSRTLRSFFLALGIFFLGLAFVGIAVPLIPTVGPVLLAAYFFSKSSERFDQWLVENRLFGGIVRDWRAGLGFTIRAKSIAIGAIIVTFTISVVFVIDITVIRVGLIALAIALVVYIAQLPTKRLVPAAV
ncbi:MAG: YbaN family protein [Actinomycetota bacterium]|nr:YbaN family protein [Actinomycetota bacterium]